jgi:hypothetical protein
VPTQQIDALNTIPLQQFLQQVKAAENSKQREIRLTIDQAKNLAFTIGIVMSRLHGDLEKLVAESKSTDEEVVEVQMDGGADWK